MFTKGNKDKAGGILSLFSKKPKEEKGPGIMDGLFDKMEKDEKKKKEEDTALKEWMEAEEEIDWETGKD